MQSFISRTSILLIAAVLSQCCNAGPLAPFILPMFGYTANLCFIGEMYLSYPVILYTWIAGGTGMLGGLVGGAAQGHKELQESRASVTSELLASIASVSSELSASTASSISVSKSIVSVKSVSHSQFTESWTSDESVARASLALMTAQQPAVTDMTDTSGNVFTFSATTSAQQLKRIADPEESPAPTTVAIPTADSLPPNPLTALPAGVPQYNVDMCQKDIMAAVNSGQKAILNLDGTNNLRVDNIPSTCMVLASLIMGDPSLGPHPIPMGTSSLQWNNVSDANITAVKKYFGSA